MSALNFAQTAYSNVAHTTKSDKSMEFDVVAGVTAKLRTASSAKGSFNELAEALDTNRRMWGVIASSVADKDNCYPEQLRAQLFYLYEFTVHHTRKVLKGEVNADALVEVNTSVLRGLKGMVSQ